MVIQYQQGSLIPHLHQQIDHTDRKINKETVALNGTLNHIKLIDRYTTFHQKHQNTHSSVHGTFSRIDYMLDHETSLNKFKEGDLQDGGGVRREDHLRPHKYIKNTSTCGTIPTEHLLNAGRRPQTSQKARQSPHTWVGHKKKENTETKEQEQDLHLQDSAVKEEKFPHSRKPLHWRRLRVAGRETSEPQRRAQQQGCRGQSREIPAQRIVADQHSPT